MLFDVQNPNKDFNWAYINYLEVGNKIIVPTFGIPEDNVVVVGYAEYAKFLRLFCLDPSWGMPCSAFWNNIIDINLDNTADFRQRYKG